LNGFLPAAYAYWWRNWGGSDNTYALFADQMAEDGIGLEAQSGFAARFTNKALNEDLAHWGHDYYRYRQGR
jgi:hypothetical protein